MEGDTVKFNRADIIEVNTLGRNGVSHFINEVSLPPSLLELVADTPKFTVGHLSFTSFIAALELADLEMALLVTSNLNNPFS
jgi:hypothetical protein